MKLACAISSTAPSATVLCRSRSRHLFSKPLISFSYWMSNNSPSTGSLHQISSSMTTSTSPPLSPWLIVGLGNPGKTYGGTRHNVGFEMIDTIADAEGISMASVSFKAQFGKDFLNKAFSNLELESLSKKIWNWKDAKLRGLFTFDVAPVSDSSKIHKFWRIRDALVGIFEESEQHWKEGTSFIGDVPIMLAKPQTFMNASGESVGAIVSYYKIPLKQVLVVFDDLDLPFAKLRLLPKGGHGGHNGMRSIMNHLKGSRDFPRLRIGIGRPPGKMAPASFVLRTFNRQEREELDFTLQNGLEAVRILVLEGFDKSATFVNSAKPLTV